MGYDKPKEKLGFLFYFTLSFLFINLISVWLMYYYDLEYIWPEVNIFINIFFAMCAFVVICNFITKKYILLFRLMIIFFLAKSLFLFGDFYNNKFVDKSKIYLSPNNENIIVVDNTSFYKRTFCVHKGKWLIYKEKNYFMEYLDPVFINWIDDNSAYIVSNGYKDILNFD